ncbi:hypothetical protein [Desulfobacter postgatei]|uniref:Uncharacterized protein n=1 Tax=Desulfobacter postgatei 2ac9 TaxID=879212 RepID=I5B366_9BACT|nr:hypothetical protein [Desulfobacter postgatei]EIM63929.1 hypothetical protein DespoDRAFT_02030 [Desulfobacter postgatei 2ac9]MDD4273994.1 hypothetical protein [Desulfobacter postgatei]MDX9964578.1 hypothetical protein [Desulfobacter postgatei]
MTQHDPNILYVDADNKMSAASEQPRPKNASAFLQIPSALEEEVNTYVNNLAKEKNIEWENEQDGEKSVFQSQGCFLVISLEKIEAVMKAINNCFSLNEGDLDEIKKNLRQAMNIINGM